MKRNTRIVEFGLAAILLSLCVSSAQSAVQGNLGRRSNGSLVFTVTKPAYASITDLNDLTLTNWLQGDGAVTLTDDLCVYATGINGGYTVTATGSGAGGAFTLASGPNTITYTVRWNSGGVGNLGNNGVNLTPGVTSNRRRNASLDSVNCTGANPGPTARIIVRVTNGQMAGALKGIYTGTTTLLITPD